MEGIHTGFCEAGSLYHPLLEHPGETQRADYGPGRALETHSADPSRVALDGLGRAEVHSADHGPRGLWNSFSVVLLCHCCVCQFHVFLTGGLSVVIISGGRDIVWGWVVAITLEMDDGRVGSEMDGC